MIIKSLELKNYRNLEDVQMDFSEGINLLYGDNAQGKTNILESIYLCGTSKSHRGSKDREIIRFEDEESHIKMLLSKREISYRIDMHLKKNRTKGVAVNGMPIRRITELFGILNVIFFSPEDLNIIKSSPSERRRFIDLELCQLDKIYTYNLINYNKIVNQRNKILKKTDGDWVDLLDTWDQQMVQYGTYLISRRQQFIAELNEIICHIHAGLTNEKEEIRLVYMPNIEESHFEKVLKKERERDLKAKVSLTGPHRDDLKFMINEIDVRTFGSQGQQRTAALSLKLSEIELVKNKVKDLPVLLLDDVLSELDSGRQTRLLQSITGIQTMVTCTGLDDFVQHCFHIDKTFHIEDGSVIGGFNE